MTLNALQTSRWWLEPSVLFRRSFPVRNGYSFAKNGHRSQISPNLHHLIQNSYRIWFPITKTNINHVYIRIYTDHIIIIWLYNSHEYHIFKIYTYTYINTCILMKTWQITNMLIYIKHITELKRFASSSDAIVGFRAHKRSEKLVKIKNWSDKIETQTRIHAKTKDLIRRLVIYLKSYTNEEDED